MNYRMPTNINFGKDCLAGLADVIAPGPAGKVLVFTGTGSAKISGALDRITGILSGCNPVFFEGIEPDPALESLERGIEVCRREVPDLIIAVGGGSVIDYAKAVSVLAGEEGEVSDFFRGGRKLKGGRAAFIAVPTTFGTSSEITPYAVMTDTVNGIKITLEDASIFPDRAFIDPKFTLTMPEELVAASCADLLSHAVEAYWNVNATELTDIFALQAIRTFMGSYKRTFESPADTAARGRIVLAGICAGLAFSNTRTTACHSISYPMTAVFGVPHGMACVLTLGEMLEFNSTASGEKLLALCGAMDCGDVREAKQKIGSILKDLRIKTRLRDYGLKKGDLALILDKGFTPERMANNPGKVTRDDLEKMLERIY